ncbi:hypothetical protein E2C01_017118 [Portunus trituberculatus]|uniref:Uncharacterized protein n=1 Tax=Portunus trituberculatus TaxID=210409 RepID=A0A5B7DSB1_PORTR|nr:hypothetical protein [Portunus trituberculatus]
MTDPCRPHCRIVRCTAYLAVSCFLPHMTCQTDGASRQETHELVSFHAQGPLTLQKVGTAAGRTDGQEEEETKEEEEVVVVVVMVVPVVVVVVVVVVVTASGLRCFIREEWVS